GFEKRDCSTTAQSHPERTFEKATPRHASRTYFQEALIEKFALFRKHDTFSLCSRYQASPIVKLAFSFLFCPVYHTMLLQSRYALFLSVLDNRDMQRRAAEVGEQIREEDSVRQLPSRGEYRNGKVLSLKEKSSGKSPLEGDDISYGLM